MELTIPLTISTIGVVISICSFILGRKDRNAKEASETQKQYDKHEVIEYRLNKIDQQLEKISSKLDNTNEIIDNRVSIALKNHVEAYHREDRK